MPSIRNDALPFGRSREQGVQSHDTRPLKSRYRRHNVCLHAPQHRISIKTVERTSPASCGSASAVSSSGWVASPASSSLVMKGFREIRGCCSRSRSSVGNGAGTPSVIVEAVGSAGAVRGLESVAISEILCWNVLSTASDRRIAFGLSILYGRLRVVIARYSLRVPEFRILMRWG